MVAPRWRPSCPLRRRVSVNTNTTLTGTINGGNGPGYYVTGGATLTVNNASLQNFTTTGGSGSGGGAGFGGAIFIDNGAAAVLNGVSFSHDTAIGGVGGTNSPIGGTLNNGVVNGYFSPTSNGSAGTTPPSPQDNSVVFGNGFGSGINGVTGTPGGSATRGFGGAGGTGQSGIPGWSSNPIAINNYELAVEGEALAADNTAVAGLGILQAATFVAPLTHSLPLRPPEPMPAARLRLTSCLVLRQRTSAQLVMTPPTLRWPSRPLLE